ncbi:MAG: mechanosensitive ion channel [Methylococcales bacterium]
MASATSDFSKLFESLQGTLGESLPSILGAITIFVIGWIVALLVRAGLRKGLKILKLNRRLGQSTDAAFNLESFIAKLAYWLIILITLIAVFNTLDLQQVSQPLNALVTQVFDYLPKLISGGILALIAWLVATVVKTVASKGLSSTRLDEKLTLEAGMAPLSDNISNILYWLTILLFLPAILGAFQLQGLLGPVQDMISKILQMLPNIFAAGVIGFVGWLVAKILRDLTVNLLVATGFDRVGTKMGIASTTNASTLIGTLVFVFVFVPSLIAALNALGIEAISQPATEMLGIMMAAIPDILAAAAILAVTYFVARFAASIVAQILDGVGFNALPGKMGLTLMAETQQPSSIVAKVIMFYAMLFATIEAAGKLGFAQIQDLLASFIQFTGQVLLGSVILMTGFWLANLAYNGIITVGGQDKKSMASLARVGILGLVTAMGLRSMGIADDIVNMAFGLTLGAIAVAVALAFGLGGREAAGKQMEYWLSQFRHSR